MSSRLYQFSGTTLGAIEWCDSSQQRTLVADSWRVEDAQVVALDRHRQRFTNSALGCGLNHDHLNNFWDAVIDELPRQGSWFPRVEVVDTAGGPTLRYRERPAPDWLDTVTLAPGASDPRTSPLTKGPDLEALMALRRSVGDVGATEALILSPEGCLVEGAYSTIALWRQGTGALSVVSPKLPRIPSVTESVLRDIATARGIQILEEHLTLADCEGAEVWVLSALHGLRLATALHGVDSLETAPDRRNEWQRAWWERRVKLPDNSEQS